MKDIMSKPRSTFQTPYHIEPSLEEMQVANYFTPPGSEHYLENGLQLDGAGSHEGELNFNDG